MSISKFSLGTNDFPLLDIIVVLATVRCPGISTGFVIKGLCHPLTAPLSAYVIRN
jgi:hypothetical protein